MDRSVTNLTTEQLYRKRAFDRFNQRESRARKKSRVSELEDEVADLKQRLVRSENYAKRLESSEAALREVLASTRSSLQLIDAAIFASQVLPSPSSSTPANVAMNDGYASLLESTTSPSAGFESDPSSGDAPEGAEFSRQPCSSSELPPTDVRALTVRDEDTGLTLGLPLSGHKPLDTFFHFWDDGFPTDFDATNAFSLTFLDTLPSELGENTWMPSASDLQLPSLQESNMPAQWERLPPHVDPTCRLDTVLLELLHSNRQHVQTAGQLPELSRPAFPSIGSLLNPESESAHSPISNAIGHHGRVTMEVPSLPVKIGMMYNMCVLVRWLISPTKRNYESLPEYLRPLESQLTIPHPIWIDLVVWPEARDRIMTMMDWFEFPIFRTLGNSISINWPYPQLSVFAAASQTDMRLNPAFEAHIRDVRNWTWGREVRDRFPFMKCVPSTLDEVAGIGGAL